jgi:hypothetical protein
MFIERLSFQVSPPDRLEDFIEADAKVWDPWLRQQKGYIRKTYTRLGNGRVDIRLFWMGEKQMQAAAAKPDMRTVEVRFSATFVGVYTRLPTV